MLVAIVERPSVIVTVTLYVPLALYTFVRASVSLALTVTGGEPSP